MKLRDIEITNWADAPMVGDGFVIEMANNEAVYTNIAEVTEDSITLFMDDLGTELLEDAGPHHQKLVQLIGKAGDNAGDMLHDLLSNFKDTSGLADHAREMYADVAIENGLHQDDDHDEIEERLLDELMNEAGMDEAKYQGREVKLGKPMAGDVKKFKVYVRDPKTGNVKKVNFGQKGVKIKKSNPARRKSFRARHNCSNPGPRTKARYWSCRKW